MISQKAALKALGVLVHYGRQRCHREVSVGFGEALGLALGACDVRALQVLDAAGAALEDLNYHGAAAIVRALKDGRNLRRNRRTMTVVLPQVFHSRGSDA